MTILIVDDHSMFRNGLIRFFEVTKFKDAIILQAENGRRAIEIVLTTNIDIILLDISMPEMNGYDTAIRILKIKPSSKIIMLTMISEHAVMSYFFKIGVKAYLTKDANEDEIIYTMDQVLHGDDRYKAGFEKIFGDKLNVRPVPKTQFSPREIEVIILISQGRTNEEIGEKLLLSTRSVEFYRSNLIKKAMVRNTAELVSYVFLNGIVKK